MCGKVLMKFTNPWVIETPEGYSVLFKAPSNSFSDLHIVEGVVDTDTYNRQINFPFVWAGTETEVDTIIPAGTPLIHVIPFKREKFDLQFDTWDHDRMTHMDMKHETVFKDKYRKLCCAQSGRLDVLVALPPPPPPISITPSLRL